jgi:hypothetical protein
VSNSSLACFSTPSAALTTFKTLRRDEFVLQPPFGLAARPVDPKNRSSKLDDRRNLLLRRRLFGRHGDPVNFHAFSDDQTMAPILSASFLVTLGFAVLGIEIRQFEEPAFLGAALTAIVMVASFEAWSFEEARTDE